MAAFVLSFREGLEAALIIGILLGALRRCGRSELGRFIWYGVAAAVVISAAAAGGLVAAGIELEGRAEQLFEGVMLILAAGFLTGMIFWMQRQGANWRRGPGGRCARGGGRNRAAGACSPSPFWRWCARGSSWRCCSSPRPLQSSVAATGLGVALGIGAAIVIGALDLPGRIAPESGDLLPCH